MLAVAAPETKWWTSDVGNSYHVADDGELVVDNSQIDDGPGQFLSEDHPHPENPSVKVTIAYGFGTAHNIIVTNGETRDMVTLIADSKMRFEWTSGEFCIYSTSEIVGLQTSKMVGGIRVNRLCEPIIAASDPWHDDDNDGDRYDTAFGMMFIADGYLRAFGNDGVSSLGKIPYEGKWRIAGEQNMQTIIIQRRLVGDCPPAYTTYNITEDKWGPLIDGDVSVAKSATSYLTEDSTESMLIRRQTVAASKINTETMEKFRKIVDDANSGWTEVGTYPIAGSADSAASTVDTATYDASSCANFAVGNVIPLDKLKSHNDWVADVTGGQKWTMPEHTSHHETAAAAANPASQ